MKIFLTVMLVVHILMEGLVGLLLMFSPQTLVTGAEGAAEPYLIYYGGAGVTMALAVVWFWPYRGNAVALSITLGLLATFHTLLTVAGALVVANLDGGSHIIVSHGVLALAFWILWTRRRRLVTA